MELYKVRNRLSMGESIYNLPIRVTFYARVSTDKDVQLNSLSNQISFFDDYIKKNKNWTFVDGYIDEGISGTSVRKRDSFLRMVEDAKDGKFDLILTKEISRFSRSTLDSIKYTQELLENGVGVLFLSDNINTIMPDSELRLTLMASIAQEEVRKLSERVKFGMKKGMNDGKVYGNSVITGYKKDNGKLVIVPEEAEEIKFIFETYATGEHGLDYISKELFKRGFKSKKGGYIHTTTIKRIIENPKYKGFYCTNAVQVLDYRTKKQKRLPKSEWNVYDSKGKIPAIVSPELWDKCNEILDKRSSGYVAKIKDMGVFQTTTTYGGLLICGEHNMPFMRECDRKRNTAFWRTKCTKIHGKKYCESPILHEEDLDKIFHEVIDILIRDRKQIINHLTNLYKETAKDKDYDLEVKKINKKIDEITLKKNKLLDLLIEGVIPKTEYHRRNEEFEEQIINYDNDIIKLKTEEKYDKEIKKKYDKIEKIISKEIDSKESFTKLVQLLIEKVVVNKIDGDRYKIKLDIYANILGRKLTYYNNELSDGENLSQCSQNQNNDGYSSY